MSTIVYRDGVLAADSRGYREHGTPIGSRRKVHKIDGLLVAASSPRPGLTDMFALWIEQGRENADNWYSADWSNFEGIIIEPDGKATFYENSLMPYPVTAEYYALGSGSEYALGALAMGADAREAVKVACSFDRNSALPIRSVRHGNRK